MSTITKSLLFKVSVMGFLAISLGAIFFSAERIAFASPTPTVTLAPIGGQTITLGEIAGFTASATDSDASGTIAYGLSGAPAGATIDPAAGTFSWDTTNAATGTYPFAVTATGSTGGSDSANVQFTVIAPQVQTATSTDGTGGTATTTGGTVITGDATASTTVNNTLNTTTVDPDSKGTTNSSTITASSTNVGILDSSASSTAETGDNTVVGGQGTNTIITGNAVSTANVINEVNTNIFNSDGLILFLNQIFGGGIDLNDYDLSYFFAGGPGASTTTNPLTGKTQCTLLTCLNSSTLNVLNTNDATITNSVIVRASTGGNVASSTGDASISTGDAYAAANVVNLVNTNIVNSSYLLLSFNNFGDINDNITLPGSDFFEKLFANSEATSSLNSSTFKIDNANDLDLTGTTTANSNTGLNMASTTTADASSSPSGDGVITTGNAYSSSNTFDQANSNNVGGTSVFLLFRVSGNWSGQVLGLPAGITESTSTIGSDEFVELASGDGITSGAAAGFLQRYQSSHFLSAATNTAAVENNVDVSADTGNNQATTDLGTSSVTTGDAFSAANVVNLVNTNIVGQNWIFGVFNIVGSLNGNIVFGGGGTPNLSIAAVPTPNVVVAGSPVTYTFNVSNTGSADANNVYLQASFDNTLLSFASGPNASSTATGESWELGPIPQGQTKTFAFTAQVGTNFPAGQSATVPLTAAVVNNEFTSAIPSNTVSAPIVVTSPDPAPVTPQNNGGGGGPPSGGGGVSSFTAPSTWTADPVITVTKTVDVATTTAPTSVNYQVVVSDPDSAGPAYNSTLTDTLTDPSGAVMYTRSWDLDTINPGDLITLTYAVAYGTSTKPGIYHNEAVVTGQKGYSGNALVALASATGNVTFLSNGLVLGDSTSTIDIATSTLSTLGATSTSGTCLPLITKYITPGAQTSDVLKLQKFLNALGSTLPTTGFFGPMTTAAVKTFQITYANDILTPAGLTKPTGLVYSLTLHKINSLVCGTDVALPSTPTPTVQATTPVAPVTPKAHAVTTPKPAVVQKPVLPKAPTVTTTPVAPTPTPTSGSSSIGSWIKNLIHF